MRLALAAVSVLAFIFLSACSGGDSSITLLLQPEIPASTGNLNQGVVLDATVGTIRKRAGLYGLDVPDIQVGADNLLTVRVTGTDSATATDLLSRRAVLEFKRPTLTVEGIVACKTAAGELFGVAKENVNPDTASRSPARCFSRDKTGDPVWAPAKVDMDELTPQSVQADGWSVRADALVAKFTPAGSATLESLTRALAGYPLAIFLDGELIAAPRIQRAITNGEAVISGFGKDQARLRAAQLNGGPLPVKLNPASSPSPS